jgi:hypothetical protein
VYIHTDIRYSLNDNREYETSVTLIGVRATTDDPSVMFERVQKATVGC